MANFGAATNLVAGTITLTLPAHSRYWFVQNQDTASLKVSFTGGTGTWAPVTLNAASMTGAAGDWLDSVLFPWFGDSVILTSTVAAAQFGSGSSTDAPGIEVT